MSGIVGAIVGLAVSLSSASSDWVGTGTSCGMTFAPDCANCIPLTITLLARLQAVSDRS